METLVDLFANKTAIAGGVSGLILKFGEEWIRGREHARQMEIADRISNDRNAQWIRETSKRSWDELSIWARRGFVAIILIMVIDLTYCSIADPKNMWKVSEKNGFLHRDFSLGRHLVEFWIFAGYTCLTFYFGGIVTGAGGVSAAPQKEKKAENKNSGKEVKS